MDAPLEVLQSPIGVGIRLNIQEKSVAGTTCGFIGLDGKLYRKRKVTTTYDGGVTRVVTTFLSDPTAVAVERDSGDTCSYDETTEGEVGSNPHIETTYEDEITIANLQSWADEILLTRDWNDVSEDLDLPLGGTKGWNGYVPFDYSGGSNPNEVRYTSFNEIDVSTVLVTKSQIGWAVTKSRVPFLISWDEVALTGGVETGRTPQTQQMGSGTWDTGFNEWSPSTNVDKEIQNARFNVPWFPP